MDISVVKFSEITLLTFKKLEKKLGLANNVNNIIHGDAQMLKFLCVVYYTLEIIA